MTPHDREREARMAVFNAFADCLLSKKRPCPCNAAVDAYRDSIEARVRWDQQADAEGYNIPGGAA